VLALNHANATETSPPNLTSQAFHDGFGFEVVGRAAVGSQHKVVDYLAMRLPPTPGGTRRPG